MIRAQDAIEYARLKLGTPYGSVAGQLDCLNLVKWVIRHAPGGDPKYTDAHVPALWASYHSSGKYKHLTARAENLIDIRPGMLIFKGQPIGADGQPHHVGIVSGPDSVIHASSAKGQVVETQISGDGWTLQGTSRWIEPDAAAPAPDNDDADGPYSAVIIAIDNDKPVNLRSGPSTSYGVIRKVPVGTIITVLLDGLDGWDYINTPDGQGYMMAKYIGRIPEPVPDLDPEPASTEWMADPTMISDTGAIIHLAGRWRFGVD